MPKAKSGAKSEIIPIERIASSIYLVRGQQVMIDADLAALYGIETKVFNQAVRRNFTRFPEDFMFQFSKEELTNWRSQIVTSNSCRQESVALCTLCLHRARRSYAVVGPS